MLPELAWFMFLMQSGLVEGQWWWQRLWGLPGTTASPFTTAVTLHLSKEYPTSGALLRETGGHYATASAGWSPAGRTSNVAEVPSRPTLPLGEVAMHSPTKAPMELDLEFKMAKKLSLWKQKKAGNVESLFRLLLSSCGQSVVGDLELDQLCACAKWYSCTSLSLCSTFGAASGSHHLYQPLPPPISTHPETVQCQGPANSLPVGPALPTLGGELGHWHSVGSKALPPMLVVPYWTCLTVMLIPQVLEGSASSPKLRVKSHPFIF